MPKTKKLLRPDFHRLLYFYIFICLLIVPEYAYAKFINTFLCKIGGQSFSNTIETAQYLAKFDKIITRKMEYQDITVLGGTTWQAIKTYNPNCEIYLYTQVNSTRPYTDTYPTVSLNNLGRYQVSRGHSQGTLDSHEEYFLHQSGLRKWLSNEQAYVFDPGKKGFQDYSLEAARTDHVSQPWSADGVYSDLFTSKLSYLGSLDEYDTQLAWQAAVTSMSNTMSYGLHDVGQKFMYNHGNTRDPAVAAVWQATDQIANPPDALLEEGAWAVLWGNSNVQFYGEIEWKRQLDVLKNIQNMDVLMLSHADFTNKSGTGIDNFGNELNYWDAFYYALGSYCLGKSDTLNNAYFMFTYNTGYGIWDIYEDEYDLINLGKSLGTYNITSYSGANIYWREFENGYVYLNPTTSDVIDISLPEACKQITHAVIDEDFHSLPDAVSLNLQAHRAAFLYKSSALATLSPPPDLRVVSAHKTD